MNSLTEYLIHSFIGLTLFYSVYAIFLRKHTFFSVNRFYLIGSVFLSLVIPFINFTVPVVSSDVSILLDSIQINGSKINSSISRYPLTSEIFFAIYFTGASIFGVRFIFQIIQILLLIRKHGITQTDGINFVLTDKNYSPFSFFNLVFINNEYNSESDFKKIIAHEQIHINQYHSVDLILIELLTIIHWFNPLVWFYRYSIKGLHEYLADEGVLIQGYDKIKYQTLLLSQTIGVQVNDLSNNFNQSLIKKRLIMMKMTKSSKWAKLRLLLSIPVISYALLSFSVPAHSNFTVTDYTSPGEFYSTVNKIELQKKDSVFQTVDEMPIFLQGGNAGLMKYISENVVFPEKGREEGIQAKIYLGFVVNKKGKVQDVEIKRIKAEKPNKEGRMESCKAPEFEAEALRVIKSLPSFTPGKDKGKPVNVGYTIPINFKLDIKKDTP